MNVVLKRLCVLLVRFLFCGLLLSATAAQGAEMPETSDLRFELTPNPYSFVIYEKATGAVLLTHEHTIVRLNGTDQTVLQAQSVVTTGTQLTAALVLAGGTGTTATLGVFLDAPDCIRIVYSCPSGPAEEIEEAFADQGEHIYGLWENPYAGGLDNRGLSRDFLGGGDVEGSAYSYARAPFYMTSLNYGIYTESVNQGSYSLAVNGTTLFRFSGASLTYHFIYGPTYAQILNQYNQVAGPSYMPPDWAFGSIWWRDDYHEDLHNATNAQQNVINDANELRNHQIPATALWIDRPYASGSFGWGNADFDASFPDPAQMVSDLNARGLELMLWIANRCSGTLYTEGTANGYLFPNGSTPAADMRIPAAYDWFQNFLTYYVNLGVKGYKIDRGHEGEMPDSVENENVPLFARMAMEGMQAAHPQDSLVFARNVNDKQRRYCGVWNGDTRATFAGLSLSVKHGLRCGLMDLPLFGSDTGGYALLPNKELFARWLEYSAYCPMMEVLNGPNRTVWYNYDQELVDIARSCAVSHHALLPYSRSCMYEATQTGMPLIRALLLAFPHEPALADVADEYLFGPSLLVAPVVEAGAVSRSVQLPPGLWADANDIFMVYQGGQSVMMDAPLNQIPVFIRAGAILPRGDILQGNNNWTPGWKPELNIECYPADGTNQTFSYYTGTSVQPIQCGMSGDQIAVQFGALGNTGSVLIACSAYGEVQRNGTILSEGTDFNFDSEGRMLQVPYSGATTVLVSRATSIFPTGPDATPPAIHSANTLNATNVVVTFDEAVDPAAADAANYSLNQGATVLGAMLIAPNKVQLTTTTLTSGAIYILVVTNVQDTSGNAVLPNTAWAFAYVAPVVVSNLHANSADPTDVYRAIASGLFVGATQYIDRAYTFTSVPSNYVAATYIETANDDKTLSGNPFLTFNIDHPALLLIGYDDRLSPPSWMSGFTDTGLTLRSDNSETVLSLYQRQVSAGSISLGGNQGVSGSSMYCVVLVPIAPDLLVDSDADGLPDVWEQYYFTNTAAGAPDADPDGDHVSTMGEYIGGTSPVDPNQYFKLSVRSSGSGGNLELNVPPASGPGYNGKRRYYALERSANLNGGAWSAVPGYDRRLASGLATYPIPAGAGGFYRARVWLE